MPVEYDKFHPGEIEETIIENSDHGTLDLHPKRTTISSQFHYAKGKGVSSYTGWGGVAKKANMALLRFFKVLEHCRS